MALSAYKKEKLSTQKQAVYDIYEICGGGNKNINSLYNILNRLEKSAQRVALDYANGNITTIEWDNKSDEYHKKVSLLFNNKLEGLLINGDPRGYVIKIESSVYLSKYEATKLHRDYGGYGIFCPDFY